MMNRWSVPSGEEFQGYDEIRRNLLYYYGNIVTFKKKKSRKRHYGVPVAYGASIAHLSLVWLFYRKSFHRRLSE